MSSCLWACCGKLSQDSEIAVAGLTSIRTLQSTICRCLPESGLLYICVPRYVFAIEVQFRPIDCKVIVRCQQRWVNCVDRCDAVVSVGLLALVELKKLASERDLKGQYITANLEPNAGAGAVRSGRERGHSSRPERQLVCRLVCHSRAALHSFRAASC